MPTKPCHLVISPVLVALFWALKWSFFLLRAGSCDSHPWLEHYGGGNEETATPANAPSASAAPAAAHAMALSCRRSGLAPACTVRLVRASRPREAAAGMSGWGRREESVAGPHV